MSHFWQNLVKDRQVGSLIDNGATIGSPGKYYCQNKPTFPKKLPVSCEGLPQFSIKIKERKKQVTFSSILFH